MNESNDLELDLDNFFIFINREIIVVDVDDGLAWMKELNNPRDSGVKVWQVKESDSGYESNCSKESQCEDSIVPFNCSQDKDNVEDEDSSDANECLM